tara:strand:+ start:10253 stop:11626 length:1374 start_codon:yes stop_codon:yes gene_type:complete
MMLVITQQNSRRKKRGFAVLASVILLCLASIMFTTYLASSQVIDNQIIANYYRNSEAFANAESGINYVLAQLDDSVIAQSMLINLPFQHISTSHHYSVEVQKIQKGKINITSSGTSMDGSAKREINVEADFYLDYPVPEAAISVNGKLNLDDSAIVNDGCEGLGSDDCLSNGNIAKQMLVSNPGVEGESIEEHCTSGVNTITEGVLKGESELKIIEKIITEDGSERYDWGDVLMQGITEIGGIPLDDEIQASSLFEVTLGFEMNQVNLDNLWNHVANIDMTSGGDCSEMLQTITEEDSIIYIKGDCLINSYYTEQSHTSENKVFTIGSSDNPKLILIEGGTFVAPSNTETSVIGMLYFLPSTHDSIDEQGNIQYGEDGLAIQLLDSNIDMSAIKVDGALLSEYSCSHDSTAQKNGHSAQTSLSARFNKQVLNQLYSKMGVATTGSGYRLTAGTWRDF